MAGGSIGEVAAEMRVDSKEAINGVMQYKHAAENADKSVRQLEQDNERLSKGLGRVGNSAGQARNALIGINYIVQDLPYGFRGVANNLDMTAQQMGMLIVSSGGVSNAFRTLFSSMTGTTGILLGFSTFIALLQIVPNLLKDVNQAASDAANEGLKDFFDSLAPSSGVNLEQILKAAEARVASVNQQIKDAKSGGRQASAKQLTSQTGIPFTENTFNAPDKEGLARLEKTLAVDEQILAKVRERVDYEREIGLIRAEAGKITDSTRNSLQKINEAIKVQEAVMKNQHATDVQIKAAREEIVRLEDQRKNLLKTQAEILKEQEERAKKIAKEEAERLSRHIERLKKSAQIDDEEAGRVKALEKIRSEIVIGAITDEYKRRTAEEQKLHLDNVANLTKLGAEEDFHALERTRHEAVIGKIRSDAQSKVHQQELADLEEFMSGIDRLGNAIHRAFKNGGDEFIQTLLAALQIAGQIKKALSGGKSGTEGTDIIGLITGGIGLAGLFMKNTPTNVPTEDMSGAASRARYRDHGPMGSGVTIILEGTLEGQQFLRREEPAYSRFKRKKLA